MPLCLLHICQEWRSALIIHGHTQVNQISGDWGNGMTVFMRLELVMWHVGGGRPAAADTDSCMIIIWHRQILTASAMPELHPCLALVEERNDSIIIVARASPCSFHPTPDHAGCFRVLSLAGHQPRVRILSSAPCFPVRAILQPPRVG